MWILFVRLQTSYKPLLNVVKALWVPFDAVQVHKSVRTATEQLSSPKRRQNSLIKIIVYKLDSYQHRTTDEKTEMFHI